MSEKPSDHFTRAFSSHTSGAICHCNCGKVYVYAADESVFEPGELERYLEHEKEDPEGFSISYEYHGNGYVVVDGKQYVFDCPCSFGQLSKVESWLWYNRVEIAQYLKLRAAEMKREAEAVSNPLEGVEL